MALIVDIVEAAQANEFFRKVISTGTHAQVVVMSIPTAGEIGEEVHAGVDQVLAFTEGLGEAILEGERATVCAGTVVHVPAGTRHNVVNIGATPLKLWTVYAPPEHADGTIHRTKAEADADEADHFVPA